MTNDRAAFDRLGESYQRVAERQDAYNRGHAHGYVTGYMDAVWLSYEDNIRAAAEPGTYWAERKEAKCDAASYTDADTRTAKD